MSDIDTLYLLSGLPLQKLHIRALATTRTCLQSSPDTLHWKQDKALAMETIAHAVMLPYPAAGHSGPFVHFAKHLARCGVAVSFISPDSELSHLNSSFTDASSSRLVTVVPFVFSIHQSEMNLTFFFSIRDWMQSQGDMFHDIIAGLVHPEAGPPVCIISDMFLGFTQVVADKLGILRYCLYSSAAHWLSFTLHMPQFYDEGRLPATSWEEPPFQIPNFPPIRTCDLPSPQHTASEWVSTFFLEESKPLWRAAGILVNTVEELEAPVIEGLRKFLTEKSPNQAPTISTLGPVLEEFWEGGNATSTFREQMCAKRPKDACFDWLDQQPDASVIYVCYGSVATPSPSQVQEIAVVLENSGHRFFWVLRTAEKEEVLPQGFVERTKSRGIVYTEWAPQRHILAHSAVGGFLSHSGWNSTTESLCMGVPMIAMPMDGDQMTNATLISSVLGVGTRINDIGPWFQIVDRQSIEAGIRTVMTDGEMRIKAARISTMLQRAVRPGGSSHTNLALLVQHLKSLRSSSSSLISKAIA